MYNYCKNVEWIKNFLSKLLFRTIKNKPQFFCLIAVSLYLSIAFSDTYKCPINQKFDSERVYAKSYIKKYQFTILIDLLPDATYISRCSISTIEGGKFTCDRYKVDKVVIDNNIGVKKFYHFKSQFNVQLFPSMAVVEDNGRGGIAFGVCEDQYISIK